MVREMDDSLYWVILQQNIEQYNLKTPIFTMGFESSFKSVRVKD